MADKIVVMRDGVVEQAGSPLQLYDRPDNMFVAGFIGSPAMNFIDGRIENGTFIGEGGFSAPASVADAPAKVVLGIRPEHLRLDPSGAEATVTVVEQTGSETFLLLDMGGRNLTYLGRDRLAIGPGETIRVTADPARLHFFDAVTGRRIGKKAGETTPPPAAPLPRKASAATGSRQSRPRGKGGAVLKRALGLLGLKADGYRPELHYMRGPGPASLKKAPLQPAA